MKKLVWLAVGLAAACGDDSTVTPDAPPIAPDAPPDASNPFVAPTPFAVPLSPAGPDQLQSAIAGPNGTFYAAGFAGPAVTGIRNLVVVKITEAGALDTTFGGGGIATTAIDFRGGSGEVNIATQSDGKIIVAGTIANAVDPLDRDVVVLRLTADGTLDATFGVAGVRVLDLNTAQLNGAMLVGLDASRGLAVGASDVIYVHAVQRGEGLAAGGGPRLDTDFTVVRLTAAGAVDLTFGGGDGKFLLDIQESNATSRGAIKPLADGSVIAGGYANSPGVGSTQPVLYKLTPAGVLDTAFASGGVFHDVVLPIQTEVYNIALHGTNIVTAGYGRATGTTNDWISLRFDINTGVRDMGWGGAANGAVVFDPSGTMLGSNCRNAIALPNGKTALVGSTGPGNMPAQDAVFAILDANGRLDTTFGDGIHVYPLGANGNDQFWGGVVSGTNVLFVGYKGGGMVQTDTVNDDAYGVILSLD